MIMMRSFRTLKGLCLVLMIVVIAGCAQTPSHQTSGKAVTRDADPSVLLMPPDILLQELTAGGQLNTNAAWSKAGERNVSQALNLVMQNKGIELVRYAKDDAQSETGVAERHQQVVKLHAAVGNTILIHKYNEQMALPTKEGRFDWTLSEEAARLGEEYDADYALFLFMRDSFSSGGRTALIVTAAILGIGVPGGRQVGFASLVDLKTGDILWFNLRASETGDLRDPNSARESVDSLLSEFPL